jgi:nitrite reductase/ring-hydroxylating ferredoxin subunit
MTAELAYAKMRSIAADSEGGALLRRSWLPVAASGELTESSPILSVRVLDEGLVLFRAGNGEVGLMQERCPHNGYHLAGSSVDENSLVCWKHGWNFGIDGACWVVGYQGKTWPVQWANARVYPVHSWGGLLWSYLGSEPAPEFSHPSIPADLVGIETVAVTGVQPRNWVDSLALAVSDGHELIAPCHSARPGLLMLRLPVDEEHTWILAVGRASEQAAAKAYIELDGQDGLADIKPEARERVLDTLKQ